MLYYLKNERTVPPTVALGFLIDFLITISFLLCCEKFGMRKICPLLLKLDNVFDFINELDRLQSFDGFCSPRAFSSGAYEAAMRIFISS